MELGTDMSNSAKSCPVSQLYLSALNLAVAVQEVALSNNVLQERKMKEPETLLSAVLE